MNINPALKKRMRKMLIVLGLFFSAIFIYKEFTNLMIKRYIAANLASVATVSATKAEYSLWQPQITASASLRAIRGVTIASELAGIVKTIYFTPGAAVEQGTILVQLNANSDIALLHSLEANAELAKITYLRDKAQYKIKAVSKQTLDADAANLKSLQAQVTQQAEIVGKKTIRAPFTGGLGISSVNLGQYIRPGDPIVMLQTLDPIYADFYLPQQALAQIKVGQVVKITTDTFPNQEFIGKITTVNPAVEVSTRNVGVEATVANPQFELAPGMFATVTVDVAEPQQKLIVPQAAISFNPYGELVYIIKEARDKKNKPILQATQTFVVTGETRGDQIVILKGLKAGDQVVTSGQLKLKNGSVVAINNSVVPTNNLNPDVPDDH